MKFSSKTWKHCAPLFEAIRNHPFNQALMKGTLEKERFAYYIEQDSLYLQEFARCHALVASKSSLSDLKVFLKFANNAFVMEKEMVHQFFQHTLGVEKTGKITPATFSYTSYLLRICAIESVELAIASLLPCFWVYKEVGLWMAKHAAQNNPYLRWIETYASESFGADVAEIIEIFDRVALETTPKIREQMLTVFYQSTCLEWHFWNDAYCQTSLDGFLSDPRSAGLKSKETLS